LKIKQERKQTRKSEKEQSLGATALTIKKQLGGHTQEGQGKERKPKIWMWLMCSLYRNECSNLKLAEATMASGLGSSEQVWWR
jgi:hypothetical protein